MMKRGIITGLLLCSLLTGCGSVAVDASEELATEIQYVALTFDDGPRRETTERLLNGLRDRGVRATFFLVGEQIPGQEDLVKRMKAEGHQVGNHTWSHMRLEGLDTEKAREEVGRTDQLLRGTLGEGAYWIRPPYGQIRAGEHQDIFQVPLIHWSVDPRDWESRDADAVTQAILEEVQPGDIILMHDIYESSVDAALRVIDTLQEQGYSFVTVEELLDLNGVELQPGHLYHNGNG